MYDSFVTQHGGSCNAMTESEYTSYEFDINTNYFKHAIDIFAQCFISPLLSNHSVSREIKAIDNEFNLARNDDAVRLQEILSSSSEPTITPINPIIKKFSWGNNQSLSVTPKSLKIDINEQLRLFYKSYYIPSNCKLVVVSSKIMSEIYEDVYNAFHIWMPSSTPAHLSDIAISTTTNSNSNNNSSNNNSNSTSDISPARKRTKSAAAVTNSDNNTKATTNNKSKNDNGKNTNSHKAVNNSNVDAPISLPLMDDILTPYRLKNPFSEISHSYITRIAAIKNIHKLHLCIHLPIPCCTTYRTQPSFYLSHLIGYEGKGSLLSFLKQESLATDLSAGVCY